MAVDRSIPSLPATSDPEFLERVKEILEVRIGQRGADILDSNPTWRQMVEAGIAGMILNGNTYSGSGTRVGGITVQTGTQNSVPTQEIDYTIITDTPDAPTNVDISDIFGTILISWDQAQLFVQRTLIYRAEITDLLPNPAVEDAVLAGTADFRLFTETLAQGKTFRYWLKHVSYQGVESALHALAGTDVATALDPDLVIETLEGLISRSYLTTELNTELDDVISDTAAVRTDVYDPTTGLTATRASLTEVRGDMYNTDGVVVSTISQLNGLQARIGDTGTGATVMQRLTATADSTGDLLASYTIKTQIESDGRRYVSGFGLASEVIDGLPTSTILFNANNIAFGAPPDGFGPVANFDLQIGEVNGVRTVAIRNANIADLAVTNAKVAEGIEARKIGAIDAAFINLIVQDASIGSAKISNTLQSDNFDPAQIIGYDIYGKPIREPGSGWRLKVRDDASAIANSLECHNILARGDIEANSLVAGAANIVDTIHLRGQAVTFPTWVRNPSAVPIAIHTGGATVSVTNWYEVSWIGIPSQEGAPVFISFDVDFTYSSGVLSENNAGAWSNGTRVVMEAVLMKEVDAVLTQIRDMRTYEFFYEVSKSDYENFPLAPVARLIDKKAQIIFQDVQDGLIPGKIYYFKLWVRFRKKSDPGTFAATNFFIHPAQPLVFNRSFELMRSVEYKDAV